MSTPIGINPISWTNDDLQYVGGHISLETCLREAATAGYAGIELGHKFPRDPAELRPTLENHGLILVSGWYSGELLSRNAAAEIKHMQEHATLLSAMGCDVLIFAEVSGCIHSDRNARISQRPRLAQDDWKVFGKRMTDVARAAADMGLKLCYHHHMGTVVQSYDDIDALMNATGDEVRLLLDTGHAYFAGADPVSLASSYAARISHLHCKDVREAVLRQSLNRDCSFLDAVLDGVFAVPGDGCIDYPAVFAPLAAAGYSGWVVVEAEQDPAVAHPLTCATRGFEHLRRLLPG